MVSIDHASFLHGYVDIGPQIFRAIYTTTVQTQFWPNFTDFVVMATRVDCGRIRLASFNSSSPKTPIRRKESKDLRNIYYRNRVIAHFSQISLPWQPDSIRGKFECRH